MIYDYIFEFKFLEIAHDKPALNKVDSSLSFVKFSVLCYKFCILSKTECMNISYHFRRDHESSGFRKQAVNKWICRGKKL